MAGKTYNGIEDFYAAVEASLPKAMEEYVAPFVEDVLSEHVESDIYDVYTPKENGWVNGTYHRRHALTWNIKSVVKDGVMSTTSVAEPSRSITGAATWGSKDGAFFDLLASGNMGLWRGGFPRPAIPKAQAEVDASIGTIETLLQRGLEYILG